MRRISWGLLLAPLLFIIAPILGIAARNAGQFSVGDLLLVLIAALATAGILYALLLLAVGRGRVAAAALAMAVLALAFFYLPALSDVLRGISWRLSRVSVLAALMLPPSVLVIWWVTRDARRLEYADRFVSTLAIVLVLWNGVALVRALRGGERELQRSEFLEQLYAAAPVGAPRDGIERDVYLVVLDAYANSTVLGQRFGYDNSAFEDSLRSLGFIVPQRLYSNYPTTMLSLPSLLNFVQMTSLAQELGRDAKDRTAIRHMIEHNRTERFFHQLGYRTILFPSAWWTPTLSSRYFDEEFHPWSKLGIRRELERTELRRVLRRGTVLGSIAPIWGSADPEYLLATFRGLESVALRPEPTFVFAHVMAPHAPYTLDAHCRAVSPPHNYALDSPVRKRGYVGQLACIDSLLLSVVTTLIVGSNPAPIILLVGDHGTDTLDPWTYKGVLPSRASLRERMSPFGAFFLPGEGANEIEEPRTLVNVMPRVLEYYFGAGFSEAPDRLYFALEARPFDLRPVPVEMIEGAELRGPSARLPTTASAYATP